jgi:hypothetical protein
MQRNGCEITRSSLVRRGAGAIKPPHRGEGDPVECATNIMTRMRHYNRGVLAKVPNVMEKRSRAGEEVRLCEAHPLRTGPLRRR